MTEKDETKAEATTGGAPVERGVRPSPTLDDLSLREYNASEYLKCLGMRNTHGLSPEERIAQTLEYNKAKVALFKARKDLEDAIYKQA